ncbi:hypothetical protein B5F53_11580 [Blautia sp. An249]|uniref:hypothetical protein n=1 Tax=Blautia sp. An249 TaxID=1965603 RepID=UPI000B37C90E|nr:hypothetical protein [Blautia sp. An249]OUO78181.1 hypothetical protein B5F53_11580 [Blautia sp. An249]
MSNKLKTKRKAPPKRLPLSNQKAHEISMQIKAAKGNLKKMEEKIWRDAWTEAEDWANTINTITLMTALKNLYGFSGKRMGDVIRESNRLVRLANEGEVTVTELMESLEKKDKLHFDERYKELVRRYGL